ncbi:hypothetical protein CHISP_2506 [Chitinispirillum alkaliphilum]|nr:hypothetical protein CHISP_2506 [Chitinispirillum alkaliphilum]
MGNSIISYSVLISNYSYREELFQKRSQHTYDDEADYLKTLQKLTLDSYRCGIAQLFYHGDVARLQEQFKKAGEYRQKLDTLVADKPPQLRWYSLTSQFLPLLAVFCTEGISAVQKLGLTQFPYLPNYEYEEDFTIGKFFYTVLNDGGIVSESFAETLLEELKELDEQDTTRYALILALKERESAEFDAAMKTLLQEHADFFSAMEGTMSCDKEAYSTERMLSIEGWAWIKIARLNGLDVSSDYFAIPQLIRHLV